jgi:hypothetical protein
VDEGGSRGRVGSVSGSGVSSSGVSSSGISGVSSNSGINVVLGVGHDRGGLGPLDDGLSLDGHGVGHVVGGIHVHGGGDLDDVLLVHGDIVGDIDATLNKDGALDIVDLNLLLDNGGVVGNGSPEDGGDRDGKMGGGRLQDPGVVAGNEAGLSVVDLLGDDGGGLVHGGDARALLVGGVWGGGGGSHVVDGVGDHRSGLERVGGQWGRTV